jgi:hypothetical protein
MSAADDRYNRSEAEARMYATLTCVTYREQCDMLERTGIEAEEPLGDVCEAGFVDILPALSGSPGLPRRRWRECPA